MSGRHYLLFYDVVDGLVTSWRVREWTTVIGTAL